eukprot:gene17468-20843_t
MTSVEFAILQWIAIVFLISLSGLFAGLTLGIMSLDITGLEIVIASGTPTESKYARKIYPIRQRGNLLLCTLLLGNVSVNTLLSILMADMTSGFVGFLLSTTIIVIAGEIIPQAACSRHALAVGAHTIWIVYIFIFLFFPFAYPISKSLDFVLGSEMGTIYSRQQLKKLLDIHSIHALESGVSRSDVTMLTGVLDFGQKKVLAVMTPLDKVFMLDIETRLDYHVMTSILENGHSRMPDAVPLKTVMGLFHRQLLKTWQDTSLDQMLTEFKTGKSHIAIVHKVNNEGEGDPFYENMGIICLEDVLEEILQDEILDESDHLQSSVDQRDRGTIDYKTIGSFHGPRSSAKLSPQQLVAIYNFLSGSLPEFSSKLISENAFAKMITMKGSMVSELERPAKGDKYVYTRGVTDEFFTLVLQGKLEIKSGSEAFTSDGGPFTTLGINALKVDYFTPDFSARVVTPSVQLLKISKHAYETAMKMTIEEYNSHVFRNRMVNNDPDVVGVTYSLTNGVSHKIDTNDSPPSHSAPVQAYKSQNNSPSTILNNPNHSILTGNAGQSSSNWTGSILSSPESESDDELDNKTPILR